MITVKVLGGAKKSFPAGVMYLECDGSTLSEAMEMLISLQPPDTPPLDINNTLLALNGADSSSLDGPRTILHDGDTISVIPVIHGGTDALRLSIKGTSIMAMCVHGHAIDIDTLRREFGGTWIQAVDARFVLSPDHLYRIMEITIAAQEAGILLSRRVETAMLLRLAQTTQISTAISDAGAGSGPVIVVAAGDDALLDDPAKRLNPTALQFPNGSGLPFLEAYTGIKLQTGSGHAPEDILAERASIL